jgi:hypothetical protein
MAQFAVIVGLTGLATQPEAAHR